MDRIQELVDRVVRQRERTDRVRVPGKRDQTDQIARAAFEGVVIAADEVLEHALDHVEARHLLSVGVHFGAHAARTVDDHLNGNAPVHVAHFLDALLRAGQRHGQHGHGQRLEQERHDRHEVLPERRARQRDARGG